MQINLNMMNNMSKFGFTGFQFPSIQNENTPYFFQQGMFPNPMTNILATQHNLQFQNKK